MRTIVTIFTVLAFSTLINAQKKGTMIDERDGKTYATVEIDSVVWMAQNLAYKPKKGVCCPYDKKPSNVVIYGYLYDWQTALNVCPDGWHLPDNKEWLHLEAAGGSIPISTALVAKTGWSDYKGTDSLGFSALPGGYRVGVDGYFFKYITREGYWWTSTAKDEEEAYQFQLSLSGTSHIAYGKKCGMSVRCVKNK